MRPIPIVLCNWKIEISHTFPGVRKTSSEEKEAVIEMGCGKICGTRHRNELSLDSVKEIVAKRLAQLLPYSQRIRDVSVQQRYNEETTKPSSGLPGCSLLETLDPVIVVF